jgi:hypothetical protein
MLRDTNRRHRPDHWVYLDQSWAKRLGVKRTAGMYRIRSRELVRIPSLENRDVDAFGTISVRGADARTCTFSGAPEPERVVEPVGTGAHPGDHG